MWFSEWEMEIGRTERLDTEIELGSGPHARLCRVQTKRAGANAPARGEWRPRMRATTWLGCRDSNPNYLIQSQASYR